MAKTFTKTETKVVKDPQPATPAKPAIEKSFAPAAPAAPPVPYYNRHGVFYI